MKYKKIFVGASALVATSLLIITPFSYKFSHNNGGFKPVIFNYSNYTNESVIPKINESFSFREYDDLPEFKNQLIEGKTIGGFSSDYQIAEFASQGLIKEIDYNAFFGTKGVVYDRTWAKNNFTDLVFKQMSNYDSFLEKEFLKKGFSPQQAKEKGQLWKFLIPYFTQDKVLGFNIEKLENLSRSQKDEWLNATPQEINAKFPDKSYVGILKTLKNLGGDNIIINDILRQNLAIGSTYDSTNPLITNKNPSGILTEENYKNLTNNFIQLIKEGTGYDLKKDSGSGIELEGSGQEIIEKLINPRTKTDVSIFYNGDSTQTIFPAFTFSKEYSNLDKNINFGRKNPVRIVRADNQISLLDGVVVSAGIDKNIETKFLKTIYENLYKGSFGTDTYSNGFFQNDIILEAGKSVEETINYLTKGAYSSEEYKKFSNNTPGFLNFDYVNYTPTTKYELNLVLNNYFGNIVKHLSEPITNDELTTGLGISYTQNEANILIKWGNYALNIETIRTNNSIYEIIVEPATDKVNTLAERYYFSQIKS